MNADKLHSEVKNTIRFLPRIPWHIKPLFFLSRLMYNIGARTPLDKGVKVVKINHNGLELSVFTSKTRPSKSAILWCFGGGHWAGKPNHLNQIASKAVHKLDAMVVVPNYRLAPQYPFPADLDDCHEGWKWMVENAQQVGVALDKLVIAGHSAGGGLAAALAQRLLDEGGVQPQAQCLFYPMLDDRTAADRSLDHINHFIWNNKANKVCWNAYLSPNQAGAATLPKYAAAARRGNLEELPPTWIGQCELDLFFDEYDDYAKRLQQAGVECEAYLQKGVPHAFEVVVAKTEISRKFEIEAIKFLHKKLFKNK